MRNADGFDPFADVQANGDGASLEGEATARAGWEIPDRITLAPGVNLSLDDPSLDGKRRRCVALTKKGERCPVACHGEGLLCAAHARRLDSVAGGHARARSLRLVREEREERMIEARSGARSIIAAKLIERASDLRKAVDVALDSAIAGERGAAKDLLGYLALAFPAPQTPEAQQQGEAGELQTLSTEELRSLAFGGPQRQAPSQAG